SGGPTITPTPIPDLDCLSAINLFCGAPITVDPSLEGSNNVEVYACLPGSIPFLDGNELIFRFVPPANGMYTAKVVTSDPSSHDLFFMLMDSCSELEDCTYTYSNIDLVFPGVAGHDLYIVVDMQYSVTSIYHIEIECAGFKRIPATNNWGLLLMIIILGSILVYSSRKMITQK
ncbi:hypothetical protein K8T06_05065, partial [bacterium]|nr:hypothetical protein [bacterium]